MVKEITGAGAGTGLRVGVVVASFNGFVTSGLLAGATEALAEAGVADDNIRIVHVPGAFEIPLAARAMSAGGAFDAVVCLGAVIRGDTPHFDYVCSSVTDGVRQVMLESGIPMAFGVITTHTVEQAIERSSPGDGNKGRAAARTAIEMVHVLRQL